MAWPQPIDYNEAIQEPSRCFSDPDLRRGEVDTTTLGLPKPRTGNFADVYKIDSPAKDKSWAVKCFTREVPGLQRRYQAISEHLRQAKQIRSLPFMVEFVYMERGIVIKGQWFPVLKMHWVDGQALNTFIKDYSHKPQTLLNLAQLWERLDYELRSAQMAHGDLQHGNVILVPGTKPGAVRLTLIDYDGMFVPTLAGTKSGEVGHPNFQHPMRLRDGIFNREIDRFSHLLVFTALHCLSAGGRSLWDRYENGENLLFREKDFKEPGISSLFHELWQLNQGSIRPLVGNLLLASRGLHEQVPLLEDLVSNGHHRSLTADQEKRVESLLAPGAAKVHKVPEVTPQAKTPVAQSGNRWWIPDPPVPATSYSSQSGSGARSPAVAGTPFQSPANATRTGPPARHQTSGQRQHNTPSPVVPTAGAWWVGSTASSTPTVSDGGTEQNGRNASRDSPRPEFSNSIGMKFVWIKPGTFMMGSPQNEVEHKSNEILHLVTLSRGFYMGIYPVTQAQWNAIMGDNPSKFKGDERPVENVSWDNCQRFVKKLRETEKKQYGLPTEAQWEYACRAGTTTPFYFGETISTYWANYDGNYAYGNGKKGEFRKATTSVGNFPANAWGLYDMHGNVWEWCQDFYGDYTQNDVVDPQGPDAEYGRVLRGGSWNYLPDYCRSAYRRRQEAGSRHNDIGCRLCFCPD